MEALFGARVVDLVEGALAFSSSPLDFLYRFCNYELVKVFHKR